ncbi:phosphate ABC transporter substrate-binding protein [bacterium]|nr:phosphate ABC transporter substrate-binding protein [bacterium]
MCAVLAVTFLSGCGAEPDSQAVVRDNGDIEPARGSGNLKLSGKLVLTGSSTVAPLAVEIAKRFETEHPDVRVDVQTGGSSRGIADALSGVADLGLASRALKKDEVEQGLVGHQLAIDGVSVIVNADNPLSSLTSGQVVQLFTGAITNWSELGGEDADVVIVNKAEGRATLEVFLNHFGLKNEQITADVVVGDNQHGIKTVAGNRLAIGYVSIGAAQSEADLGTPIRVLPVDGIELTTENVASGAFKITRPLLIVSKGEPTGLAAAFLDYAKSPQMHDLIRAQGFEAVTQ